jgi:hypothetical protein
MERMTFKVPHPDCAAEDSFADKAGRLRGSKRLAFDLPSYTIAVVHTGSSACLIPALYLLQEHNPH